MKNHFSDFVYFVYFVVSNSVPLSAAKMGLLALIGVVFQASAQTNFTSGSDGSYGPLNITTNTTLILPTNGIFNCTTITIASGVTLAFTKNPLNTPVYLLATGDVLIAGTINVSGQSGVQALAGEGGPGDDGPNRGRISLAAGGHERKESGDVARHDESLRPPEIKTEP